MQPYVACCVTSIFLMTLRSVAPYLVPYLPQIPTFLVCFPYKIIAQRYDTSLSYMIQQCMNHSPFSIVSICDSLCLVNYFVLDASMINASFSLDYQYMASIFMTLVPVKLVVATSPSKRTCTLRNCIDLSIFCQLSLKLLSAINFIHFEYKDNTNHLL